MALQIKQFVMKNHPYNGQYYICNENQDNTLYLHSDGKLRHSAIYNGKESGWYKTKSLAIKSLINYKVYRLKIKKGGRHQSFKWCLYIYKNGKCKGNTPSFHSKSWKEVMIVAVSMSHQRTVFNTEKFGWN